MNKYWFNIVPDMHLFPLFKSLSFPLALLYSGFILSGVKAGKKPSVPGYVAGDSTVLRTLSAIVYGM
jgi:hypothetical protein